MGRIDGRVAVITGGAHGLGQATARRFAEEGARLMLADIDGDALATMAEEIGGDVETLTGDVTDERVAEALIDRTVDRFGHIDILVNNVGGSRNAKIWEMSVADWDYTIRLNLRGMFLCTRFAVPRMMDQGGGKIVCLSSGAREGTPWLAHYSGGAAYSACKAGVHGFIRDVAMELAEHKITVNAVAPGPIDTDRVGPGLRELETQVDKGPIRLTPMGRLGLPEEVANAILFLASDDASYITGHTLAVAGGR